MRAVLTCWADPSMYLATTFTAKLLSERGIYVDLVYRRPNPQDDVTDEVDYGERTRIHAIGGGRSGWRDKFDYARYVLKLMLLAWKEKPKVIIGYNTLGLIVAFIVTRFFPKIRLVYHNFDFDASNLKNLLGRIEMSAARRADLTIFPALGRCKEYRSIAGLKQEPLSVLNCYPLSWPTQKTGEFQKILKAKGLCFDRLVVRLGMMGPFHGIEATIRSMVDWQGSWGLILGGFSSDAYLDELGQLIEELGLKSRVLILPSVSASLWYDILLSGDLGICLYEPYNLSHVYMAGTSQKLNGYFVAGIPSIVPDTPDFQSFVEQYGTSKIVDVNDPRSIAEGINSLLCDPNEYAQYCGNVKLAFQTEFNFEKQFKPVLHWLDCHRTQ